LAVASVGAAAVIHSAFAWPYGELGFTLLVVPAAVSAYYGGVGGGVVTGLLVALLVFLSPNVRARDAVIHMTEMDTEVLAAAFVIAPSVIMGLLSGRLRLERERVQRLNAELRALSMRDGLTGLYNHSYFQETFSQMCTSAAVTGTPFSVLVIDVNNFKQLNDVIGHSFGDLCLQRLAQHLIAGLRVGDIACRYGGDEFAALLPGAELPEAEEVAARIRALACAAPVDRKHDAILSVAVGVAAYGVDGSQPSEIFNTADKRMYTDKAGAKLHPA
jgi:diguanylate cyclase (GGDEF)-like protein